MQQLRKVAMLLPCLLTCSLGACIQHGNAGQELEFAGPPPDDDPADVDPSGGAGPHDDIPPLFAEQQLPAYYEFIKSLKARGFVFMSFGEFWAADKSTLPERLIVVRHDVHHRDVRPAYAMHAIERHLGLGLSASYFVMLGFPKEAGDASWQKDYLDLIGALSTDGVDVQPHVSPDDMYVSAYSPDWAQKSRSQLIAFTAAKYDVVSYDDGVEIAAVPHDPLDIRMLNVRMLDLLRQYNQSWSDQTGLTPRYYAAHGSNLPLNHVLNNATILDQRELIASGVYEFDTYNTRVHDWLADLSDNEQPDWMDDPQSIAPGRYQLLAHPRSWQQSDSQARKAREAPDIEADSRATSVK